MIGPKLSSKTVIVFTFPRRKNIVCPPYQMPPLENVVEDEFDVDGKGVTLRAGIVQAATYTIALNLLRLFISKNS